MKWGRQMNPSFHRFHSTETNACRSQNQRSAVPGFPPHCPGWSYHSDPPWCPLRFFCNSDDDDDVDEGDGSDDDDDDDDGGGGGGGGGGGCGGNDDVPSNVVVFALELVALNW